MFRALLSLITGDKLHALTTARDAAAAAAESAAQEHMVRSADLAARTDELVAGRTAFESDGSDEMTDRVLAAETAHARASLRQDRAERRRDELAASLLAASASLDRALLAASLATAVKAEQEARAGDLTALASFEASALTLAEASGKEQEARRARASASAALAAFDGLEPAQRPGFAESLTFDAVLQETAEDIAAVLCAQRVIEMRRARAEDVARFQRVHAQAVADANGGGGDVQPVPARFIDVHLASAAFQDQPEAKRGPAACDEHAYEMIQWLGYNTNSHGHLPVIERFSAYLQNPLHIAERILRARR
jgi:hypothetical protein